jgi:hypothetical protein
MVHGVTTTGTWMCSASCEPGTTSSRAHSTTLAAARMIIQLAAIHAHGLLEPRELERFTERTRATIESLARDFTR